MKDVPKRLILDACILAKWVLDETESNIALRLQDEMVLGQIEVWVPDHCFSETLNTLARKNTDLALEFFVHLHLTSIVQCRLTAEVVFRTIKLIKKYPKVTFYDAAYHALALEKNGLFVTADEKYYQATRREGSIRLLKDYAQRNL